MSDGTEDLVRRLAYRVEASFPDVPSIADLAREFAMSPRYFSHCVRAGTGMPPKALIQSARLARARRLIEAGHLTIDEVAREVGYGSGAPLRALFRRSMGTTPRSVRIR